MTREEAREILTHNWTRVDNPNYSESELDEAFFMAIEALSAEESVTLYATPKATYIRPLTEEIAIEFLQDSGWLPNHDKEIGNPPMLVRCKDCIHWKADNEVFELGFCCVFPQKWVAETFYCADGERREE